MKDVLAAILKANASEITNWEFREGDGSQEPVYVAYFGSADTRGREVRLSQIIEYMFHNKA